MNSFLTINDNNGTVGKARGIDSGIDAVGALTVNGTVHAGSFKGDGSALTGINAGKWKDGPDSSIHYNGGNVGIGTTNTNHKLEIRDDDADPKFMVHTEGPYSPYFVFHIGDRVWDFVADKSDHNKLKIACGGYADVARDAVHLTIEALGQH